MKNNSNNLENDSKKLKKTESNPKKPFEERSEEQMPR